MKFKPAALTLIAFALTLSNQILADNPPAPPGLEQLKSISFPTDAQFPGQGPIPKAEWFQKTWIGRRNYFATEKQNDHGTIIFLGDSITQGWTKLAQDFPDLKVANRGINGDMTRSVWQRLQEDVLDLEPKAIVLLIGTNDLGEGGKPEEIASNVKNILHAIHLHNSKTPVIVCKVMPSSSTLKRPADKIKKVNELVDVIVTEEPNCQRCDTWSIFADENGNAKKEEFNDLLHPNAPTYAKWKTALDPLLAKVK